MGRIKTAGLLVTLLGCVGCACPNEGWRTNPLDVVNGCTVDIVPEPGNEIGPLRITFLFEDVKTVTKAKLTVFLDNTLPRKDVYIGGVQAKRGSPNVLEVLRLNSQDPNNLPIVKLNGTKVQTLEEGTQLANYSGFGLQADIQSNKTIWLRLHNQVGIVLAVTTTPPGG